MRVGQTSEKADRGVDVHLAAPGDRWRCSPKSGYPLMTNLQNAARALAAMLRYREVRERFVPPLLVDAVVCSRARPEGDSWR